MVSITYLCICIYCMLQLGFLLLMSRRREKGRSFHECYFSFALFITLISFVGDIFSILNHYSNWIFPFAAAGNYIEIILNTILLPVYFLYVCIQIPDINLKLKRNLAAVLWILTFICSVIVISTVFNGKVFYYDEARNYHRGSLFLLPVSIQMIMMLIIQVFIILQRNKIEMSYYKPLLAFLILPLVGLGLQSLIYGLPFTLMSITFAAQVVYTNVQNRSIDTDYLTGVFNRKSLDTYLQNKIDAAIGGQSFSALLLDIDNFKSINDSFGHYEGDNALINAIKVLRSAVGHKDFIARYGGDEFCIIFDEDGDVYLEKTLENIYCKLRDFNNKRKKPYELSFSIGYAVYDSAIAGSGEQFIKLIDQRMYADKMRRKAENTITKK